MSELDQKAKSSVRADVVRFCPEMYGPAARCKKISLNWR
jgi:hypothetical protein